jgi:hypothetical protein
MAAIGEANRLVAIAILLLYKQRSDMLGKRENTKHTQHFLIVGLN